MPVLLIMLKPCHFHQLLLRGHYTRETITLPVLLWKDMAFSATVLHSQTFKAVMKRRTTACGGGGAASSL